MFSELKSENWIRLYIYWELSLIKDLGFEVNFSNDGNSNVNTSNLIEINNKSFTIPKMLFDKDLKKNYSREIKEALIFNKNLFMENFILPNKLKFPLYRNILESYYQ